METNSSQITAYSKPKAGYVFAIIIFLLAAISLSLGLNLLSIICSAILVLIALWIFVHPKSSLSVDKNHNAITSTVFGFKTWKIPISDITKIGTTGSFLGAITIMTIKYRKSNGAEKRVRSGSKQMFEKDSFQKVLHSLTENNSNLHIPAELEN